MSNNSIRTSAEIACIAAKILQEEDQKKRCRKAAIEAAKRVAGSALVNRKQ